MALPSTFGTTDWQNVAGLNAGIDVASGSGDNSFGQGTKEDNAAVTVVSGSIPPNKSDLTRFYEASEFANGSNFLYLAWERTNVLGSANMDFEINQATTPGLGSPGAHTINRMAGDLLVTFDFTNGGGTPTLGLLTWVTSGSTGQCFSSNSLPCWGNHVTLNGTESIGAVNNLDAVSDPIPPNAPRSLAALTFGETAINLTSAGIFPAGTCVAFGSTFLKSRASASFGSEVKDFVAPVPVNISNCGEVIIVKNTDPRGISQDFSFQSTVTGTIKGTTTACPANYSLNDGASSTNTLDCADVPVGGYTASETEPSASYVLESLTCSPGGTQDGTNPLQADITVTAGATVTCTFVNKLQQGAIKISKTSIKGPALGGATFSITGPGSYANSVTTGSDGTVCVDHLVFGAYSVQETAAPPGYSVDDSSAHNVTVSTNATCGSGNEATFSATDTPLTDIGATATSEATGGTTSTIVCRDANNNIVASAGPGGVITASAIGLKPGTYTCTIVVDP